MTLIVGQRAWILFALSIATTVSAADLLETLTEQFKGTDKARDDHNYVDLYSILLDPIRNGVLNMTEVGVAHGLSLEVWHSYMPNAQIYGLDKAISPIVRKRLRRLPRLHLLTADATNCTAVRAHNWLPSSMDLIVDDGPHWAEANEALLRCLWPALRPGGLYMIEDAVTGTKDRGFEGRGTHFSQDAAGFSPLAHDDAEVSMRHPDVTQILHQNQVFFADTSAGHRAWSTITRSPKRPGVDHTMHNSHVLVIRKLEHPRTRPVRSLFGDKLQGSVQAGEGSRGSEQSASQAESIAHLWPQIRSGAAKCNLLLSLGKVWEGFVTLV